MRGLCLEPRWGRLQRSPDLARFGGGCFAASMGKEGKRKRGKGMGGNGEGKVGRKGEEKGEGPPKLRIGGILFTPIRPGPDL